MRVHELAKELNVDSKELIEKIRKLDMQVKSHMSSLSDEQVSTVKESFGNGKPKRRAAAPKTVPPPTRAKAAEKAEPAEEDDETPAQETVVEQRVSRTVIRRRKKVQAAPAETAEQEAAADVPESVEQPQVAAPAGEREAPSDEVSGEVPAAEAPPVDAESAQVVEAAQEPSEKKQQTKKEKAEDAEARPVEQQQVKKVRIRETESTPARIIDRIDLGTRTESPKTAPAAKPAEAVAEKSTDKKEPPKGAEPEKEKDDRPTLKQKGKQKKFNWRRELEQEEEGVAKRQPRHKRVRYKVKDRQSQTGKRQKGEVVPFSQKETEKTVPKASKRIIRLQAGITVGDLAKRMGIKATEIIKKLVELGEMATINQTVEIDTASLVAHEFGYEIETVSIEEETIFEDQTEDAAEDMKPRSPVVTVMGHVDHGKTSLLDAIRKTKVVDGEHGGITQHIGAYRVSTANGDITFVDTPGHEAFTAMRARGAQVTDIIILVVAAEEGVKPQTIEAINHARAAGVPFVVAVNKIDKPEANPEKIRQELSQHGVLSEEWGGDIIFIDVSAKQNLHIDKLLEMVLLQAEMLELKANPDKRAKGTIIEARLDRGRGSLATVLVQEGTLRTGDSFVSRHNFGKVRAMLDDHGRQIKEAGPSAPVEVLGFSSVPEAGDVFLAVDDKTARQTSDYWQQKKRDEELRKDAKVNLENFFSQVGGEEVKELRVVLKADVQGSAEALQQSLETLSTDEITVNAIHASVGAVSLNDVMLASASNAIIIGFGVKSEPKVTEEAAEQQIDLRFYNVIYEVIDDVKKAMAGMLAPVIHEKAEGRAEVRQVFDISKLGTIAGCFIIEGRVLNGAKARVLRGSDLLHEGEITSLKHFKEDAREVPAGQECGIFLGSYKEFAEGDIIECFTVEERERTL